jgi:serine/threonine protein kinase
MPESRTGGASAARTEQSGPASSPKVEIDPLIGRTINGRFKIVSVIARGGMGKVYKAEQAPLGRLCALKVLSPKYEGDRDPEFHKRFFLEAATAAKLNHPNTVTIFDYGQSDDNIYYIAMEYIEGRTLHRVLREDGPMAERRVAYIGSQICRSLREAHSLGVVHRDLKPGNILLTDRGDEQDTVKVLDFGLVKDLSGEAEDLTQAGLFMGSPKYMAPEQILGGEISPRTDVYSLGVMMYEMLTGKVPFDRGASVGTLMAHVNEAPTPIRVANPQIGLSPAMESIVNRCLEKEPSKRFVSMKDLLNSLKRIALEEGSVMLDTHESMPLIGHPDGNASYNSIEAYSGPLRSTFGKSHPPSALRQSDPRVLSPSFSDTGAVPGPAPPADTDASLPTRAKGRTYVWVMAAAVAMGITVMMVVSSKLDRAADTPDPTVTPASTGTPAPGPTLAAPATSEAPAAVPALRTIRVESEPAGASVSESGTERCMATPCELIWKDDTAITEHRLSISKRGYKTAKVTVAKNEEKVSIKLDIIQGGGGRPNPQQGNSSKTGGDGKPTSKPNPYGD